MSKCIPAHPWQRLALLLIPTLLSLNGALAAPPGVLPAPTVPDGLGVNIHFADPRPGEMEMLAAAGFRWVRMDFAWGATEKERGKYDFAPYERLLAALDAHKMHALLILDYSNKLYEADRSVATEAGRQAFAHWAAAAATHFKGRGILWEIWNEPNISQFWKPQPNVEQYAALALAAARAIREAAPGEAVIGPATSTIDRPFLEGCFKAGLLKEWDAVSVHPYRQSDPETAAMEYYQLRRLIAQYAPKAKTIPILSAEWGYSAGWKSYDAEKQGEMLPRQWLINLANGIPLSIWYDWHDDGKEAQEPEHHFGTVAFDYHPGRDSVYDPKPAYLAAKTLTSVLGGYHFTRRLAIGDSDDYALLFSQGDDLRLAVWTTAAESHEVRIPSGKCQFVVLEHTGKERPALSTAGHFLTVTATDAPQYLVVKGANPELASAPAAGLLGISWVRTARALTARVENTSAAVFKGTARLVDVEGIEPITKEQPLAFTAVETDKNLRFPLARSRGDYLFGLRVEDEGGGLLFALPAQRFLSLDDVLTPAKLLPDGDPKVPSEQTLTLATAPEPLPDPDAAVVKITYRFGDGWKFLCVVPQRAERIKIAGEPKAFGVWIYGDGQHTAPRMRVVDAKGQTWQPSGDAIDWTGWRYVQLDLKPSTFHWGGANDGVIHFPLSWDSVFLLDNVSKKPKEGTIYLAVPVVVY
jgi:hypothetical protein